ncbi:MAG: cytochrome P450, partial [Halalkalicoccus sp.]
MRAADPQAPLATFPEELSTREGWLEPFSWYARMREHAPIRYDERREIWDAFRYDDVKAILADDSAFSSDPSNAPGFDVPESEQSPIMDTVLFTDPPDHRRLRSVVEEFFRPRAVADLAARIEAITDDLLDDALAGGEFDLVEELAYPMPVIVIAEMLGVPAEDRGRFKEWSDALVARPDGTSEAELDAFQKRQERVLEELSAYFAEMIELRRAEPRDDLISALVEAEVEGHELTEREVLGFCMLLLVAGNITRTNLLASAMRCFAERPE